MMQYLDLSMLNSRAYMVFGLVVLMTVWLFRHAGRRWFPPMFFIGAAIGGGLYTGVLRQSAIDAVHEAATGKFDAANARAKAIGGQAHATSAGSAGETNDAYKKRMDRTKRAD